MAHRESIRQYLEATILPKSAKVVDWGCGTKPVKRYVKHEGATFYGIDKLGHVGADLVTDIEAPTVLDKQYDHAFCMEVLEHTKQPEEVLNNIYINLKPNGILHMSVPFLYKVHSEEDYWRFTDQGLVLLLERNGFKVDIIIPTEDNMGWIARARRV